MYIYIYTYIYICVCVCVHTHIYIYTHTLSPILTPPPPSGRVILFTRFKGALPCSY